MNTLYTYLHQTFPSVSLDTLKLVTSSFMEKNKEQGDMLLEQGNTSRNIFFLSKGITRSFSIKDGRDITTWFGFENEFITSFTSFFPEVPSYESIEMLTDGCVFQISKNRLKALMNKSMEIEKIIHHFSSGYTIQLEKRLFILQTQSAKERYLSILKNSPELINLIYSKHLASYLGISRETLSRIRSRIN